MKYSVYSLILFIALALAEVGDKCQYGNLVGTCTKVSKCITGFTVVGACPNDPANVKCCLGKDCTNPKTKTEGICLDSDRITCGNGVYITGRCPGPKDVQCCVSDGYSYDPVDHPVPSPAPGPPVTTPKPVPVPVPTAPKCPKIRVKNSWGIFTYSFSQDLTNDLKEPGFKAAGLAAACGTFIGLTSPTVALPVAIAAICGIGAIELGVLASQADSCDDKQPAQCLQVKYFPFSTIPIPFCVGADKGCCGGDLGGTSEGFIIE